MLPAVERDIHKFSIYDLGTEFVIIDRVTNTLREDSNYVEIGSTETFAEAEYRMIKIADLVRSRGHIVTIEESSSMLHGNLA